MGQEIKDGGMTEKICSNCYHSSSTYPLDPIGTLYCEIMEDYIIVNDNSCGLFSEDQPLVGLIVKDHAIKESRI